MKKLPQAPARLSFSGGMSPTGVLRFGQNPWQALETAGPALEWQFLLECLAEGISPAY